MSIDVIENSRFDRFLRDDELAEWVDALAAAQHCRAGTVATTVVLRAP